MLPQIKQGKVVVTNHHHLSILGKRLSSTQAGIVGEFSIRIYSTHPKEYSQYFPKVVILLLNVTKESVDPSKIERRQRSSVIWVPGEHNGRMVMAGNNKDDNILMFLFQSSSEDGR